MKNIVHSKSVTSITIMSLGLGITLLLTLVIVGSNFKEKYQNLFLSYPQTIFLLEFKILKKGF